MRTAPAFALMVTGVLLLSGCGARKEVTSATSAATLRVATVAPGPAEAPVYAAAGTGELSASGLSVELTPPARADQVVQSVASGAAALGVSTAPAVMEARARGLPVESVAAIANGPLAAAIWLPGGRVHSPSDLAHVTVGTSGPDYERAFAEAIAGSPRVVTRAAGGDLASALERRTFSAVIARSDREGAELTSGNAKPVLAAAASHGVPAYDELVLVAPTGELGHEGDLIRSFVGALSRAARNLRRGDRASLAAVTAADTGLSPNATRAGLARVLPLFEPPAGQPPGFQDPAKWRSLAAWMNAHGLQATPAFTNAYLPGQGL